MKQDKCIAKCARCLKDLETDKQFEGKNYIYHVHCYGLLYVMDCWYGNRFEDVFKPEVK